MLKSENSDIMEIFSFYLNFCYCYNASKKITFLTKNEHFNVSLLYRIKSISSLAFQMLNGLL